LQAEPPKAARTLSEIETASDRQAGVRQLPPGTAGGGAIADFDTLMNLIQQTIAPDTWETLGGPSSLFPYPGGIYVDSAGLLQETVTEASTDPLAQVPRLLRPLRPPQVTGGDWQQPAALRCVSLRRLGAEIGRQQATGRHRWEQFPAAIQQLAGLSEIRYVMLDPVQHDIVLAGRCGGIERSRGWPRDRESGQGVISLAALVAALQAAQQGQPFGCSIDPTEEGIAAALQVADAIRQRKLPLAAAAPAMQEALGKQRIEVFGTAPDQPLAWLLVEADRHMKELALGKRPMPEGVDNYLDAVDRFLDQGPPDGQLLRLWLTGQPMALRSDPQQQTFALAGWPLRLASERQVPDRRGRRHAGPPDGRLEAFAEAFNEHFSAIVDRYPIYGAVAAVYRAAAVAAVIDRYADELTFGQACQPLLAAAQRSEAGYPVPRQVESIAVMHTAKRRRKRYHILVASGGVLVGPEQRLVATPRTTRSLTSVRPAATEPPALLDRWWWNVPDAGSMPSTF